MDLDIDHLIKLTKKQIRPASEVAGRAFHYYPISVHMFPDDAERTKREKYGFQFMLNYGIKCGTAFATSPNLEGIAIWLPPQKVHQNILSMLICGGFRVFRKSGLKAMKRGLPLFNYMEPAHKRLAPFDHWYLQCLAVEPKEQGKGYGSILLNAMFKEIDKKGLPTYLETNKVENVSFYQSHGFEVVEHKIAPKTDVPFWCMLRKEKEK